MGDLNENLISGANKVIVPYRWVSAVGDVIILRHFPEKLSLNKQEKDEEEFE
jgi:sporulation protein YlmC with PRC-barrel domain